MTRRGLILLMGILAWVLTFGKKVSLGMIFARPDRKEQPRQLPNRFTDGDLVPVGVAPGPPDEAVRRAVELVGGLERLELQGKSVLVKPNVVSGKPHPTTTSPGVVAAVVRMLRDAGASKVYVGDMSALITLPLSSTRRNMEKCGILQAAREAGAELIGFEDGDWVEIPLDGTRYIDKALVTEWLFRVDLVVNLPVIKTHRSASYSICLKNFIGCTHLRQRPYLVDSEHWEELVTEFNLAYRPALHIVDGTVTMIRDGPWDGPGSATNLIIASGDAVAADLVGLGIIKSFGQWPAVVDKNPWKQRQIRHAQDIGLAPAADKIRLLTAAGDDAFDRLMDDVRRFTGLEQG